MRSAGVGSEIRLSQSRLSHTTKERLSLEFHITDQAYLGVGDLEDGLRSRLQAMGSARCCRIRECLRRAEECKRLSKTALSLSAIQDYLDMEQRWLKLARSYEFTERLSRFTEPFRKGAQQKA